MLLAPSSLEFAHMAYAAPIPSDLEYFASQWGLLLGLFVGFSAYVMGGALLCVDVLLLLMLADYAAIISLRICFGVF